MTIQDELFRIKQFVEEMQESNSRTYKESVLRKYELNDTIKEFLYFMYNPYITTGISDGKLSRDISLLEKSFVNMDDLYTFLQMFNTGTDEVIAELKWCMKNQIHSDYISLLRGIITKNIKLGIEATTINKVFPKLIPQFNIQLAEKYFEHTDYVEGKEFAITTKIDGGRILAVKQSGVVKFYTRAGQEYEGLVDIENELKSMNADNFVIDGEITLLQKGNLTSKEQYKETMKITRKDGEKHGVKILAFDCLYIDEFISNICTRGYVARRKLLESLATNLNYIDILPVLYKGSDTSMITKLLDEQISKGEEGVMINLLDAPYRFKRTLDLLKVKKMQDIDLKVIGFEEGSNRHSGKLGAFLVDYKGNVVKVGTGISDELRAKIWNNKSEYLGVTIAVRYFEETTNDKGGTSLRFPVFIDFRFDKPEV